MTEEQAYEELDRIFHEIFLRADLKLSPSTTAADIEGWDSFKQIEIVLALEERFGIKFKTREIDALKNVGDLVAGILRKVPAR